MEKKELYMIGNSHIDPVWFWNWEEGMQEVKSTFASALDRMKEFDEFKFSCTSVVFFRWIEKLLPAMFEEIKERVAEGRWEITGGWFLEPDCILPTGEAFVRHALYGQRYLKSRFGKIATIGSNVDSFGHNAVLPQLLKKSGMDSYVFMRPRINTSLFQWESADGSKVTAICLPAEYTTWFREPTIKNMEDTLERSKDYARMVCCYGVGNHGGGPTIENISTILDLQEKWKQVVIKFATFEEFLADMKKEKLPVIKGAFEKINQGCYSIDSTFKQMNRLAETRLLEADTLMSMAANHTGTWMEETQTIEKLWSIVHFNEFHDTMGGTDIHSARNEAIMQLSAVCAEAGYIKAIAIQSIANNINTKGQGQPLVLFHTGTETFQDYVEVELEWFCQSPLKIMDDRGVEIPYQRIHTDAKIRHTVLGGRRRIIFDALIPPCGYSVYWLVKEESKLYHNEEIGIDNPDSYLLENPYIKAVFSKETGMLCELTEKESGCQILRKPVFFQLYQDERDAWGSLQEREYKARPEQFQLESISKVESGAIRETIRVRVRLENTTVEQLYSLGKNERELRVENRLNFQHKWSLLKFAFPLEEEMQITKAETAYGYLERKLYNDATEYNMQRFLDISNQEGKGIAIANDGKYSFHEEDGIVGITVARSAIYAQGNSPMWYNDVESYEYTDQGVQTFHFVLKPHSKELAVSQMHRIADKINKSYEYLADSIHEGKQNTAKWCMARCSEKNVCIMVIKKAEESDDYIIRLLETEGRDTEFVLCFCDHEYSIRIGHYEIKTIKIGKNNNSIVETNFMEWEEKEGEKNGEK